MSNTDALARRKALLVTQCEVDRTRVAVAAQELRWSVLPPRVEGGDGSERSRVLAARLAGLAVPLLGVNRSLRVVRTLSLAIVAYRVIRRLLRR
jgi:hypothetical protein